MSQLRKHNLVLGIYPDSRGFAFMLFEGPLAPVDWGTREARGEHKIRTCVARISKLLGQYAPDALVLQNMTATGTQRASGIKVLNEAIALLAETQGIPVFFHSRAEVRERFATLGAVSKDAIAGAIGKHIPMLERLRPPARKPWKTEHPRMALFDAAALVQTFYQSQTEDGNDRAKRGRS